MYISKGADYIQAKTDKLIVYAFHLAKSVIVYKNEDMEEWGIESAKPIG